MIKVKHAWCIVDDMIGRDRLSKFASGIERELELADEQRAMATELGGSEAGECDTVSARMCMIVAYKYAGSIIDVMAKMPVKPETAIYIAHNGHSGWEVGRSGVWQNGVWGDSVLYGQGVNHGLLPVYTGGIIEACTALMVYVGHMFTDSDQVPIGCMQVNGLNVLPMVAGWMGEDGEYPVKGGASCDACETIQRIGREVSSQTNGRMRVTEYTPGKAPTVGADSGTGDAEWEVEVWYDRNFGEWRASGTNRASEQMYTLCSMRVASTLARETDTHVVTTFEEAEIDWTSCVGLGRAIFLFAIEKGLMRPMKADAIRARVRGYYGWVWS